MPETSARLPDIRVPAGWTFAALVAGLVLGMALGEERLGAALAWTAPVGEVWLRALQMTIVPLVAALMFTGVVRAVGAAQAGAMARRTVGLIALLLVSGATMAALVMPLLLDLAPVPADAARALAGAQAPDQGVPGLAEFLTSLVPENAVAAAAGGAMLPLIVFVSLFALASTRLGEDQRGLLARLFEALAAAMVVVIGWVLAAAPFGVFALALGVAARSGTAAFGALAHYIGVVAAIGGIVTLAGVVLALAGGRLRPRAYGAAMLPVWTVAVSTQSSLASLPAMLGASRRLGVREGTAEFVLPLAVALFRATGPAMNLAVAIYVCALSGVELTPATLAIGVLAASLTTLGSPSLPGSISFVTAIAPIAVAMGAPVAPLALLVAVEMLPDIVRTLGNVTMDVALAATVDRRREAEA